MAYKSNGEFEEIERASDVNQKTCLFTDYCFDRIKDGAFPPLEGDRAKYYSWAQVILRELALLPTDEREYLIMYPTKIRVINFRESEKDFGDWMRHDVGFCKERKQRHRVS